MLAIFNYKNFKGAISIKELGKFSNGYRHIFFAFFITFCLLGGIWLSDVANFKKLGDFGTKALQNIIKYYDYLSTYFMNEKPI